MLQFQALATYFIILSTFNCQSLSKQKVQTHEVKIAFTSQWLPVLRCPWGQSSGKKSHDKCDRGDFNMHAFRDTLKKDLTEELPASGENAIQHIEPVVVRSKYSNSLFCMIDKSGSTAWRRVINKAMGADENKILNVKVHTLPLTRLGDLNDTQTANNLLDNPDVLRWMIVRNPYARVFSSYFEKLVRGHNRDLNFYRDYFQFDKDYEPTFSEFVHHLYSFYNGSMWNPQRKIKSLSALNGVDRHFDLQTSRCGMPQGFGQDYILKSELINEWYPKIIEILNFTEIVMSGWPEKNNCFLITTEMECNGPKLHKKGNSSQKEKSLLHTKYSSVPMLKAYTEELAAMVTEMYLPDFVGLNYPIWNGDPKTFQEF